MSEQKNNPATINLQPSHQIQDDEDIPLFQGQKRQTPSEEFFRQKNIAEEACQLGRKLLTDKDYTNASKQFSKAVMTFEYILKNNPKMSHLKEEIAHMVRTIIMPAYSNLSLCYLKMEHWNMVINFSNQVLQNDPSNVKNLYRRGVARKMSKMFDQAIEDFEKVITYDNEMRAECTKQIAECKQLKKGQKKKSKQWAKQFINGYAADKPEPKPVLQTQAPSQKSDKESWWIRGIKYMSQCCPKIFGRK